MTSAEHQRPSCQDRRKGGPKPWPQGYCLHASSCSSEEGAWGATCVQASQQCPPPIGSRMFLLDSLSVLRESHSIARKSKQPEDFPVAGEVMGCRPYRQARIHCSMYTRSYTDPSTVATVFLSLQPCRTPKMKHLVYMYTRHPHGLVLTHCLEHL